MAANKLRNSGCDVPLALALVVGRKPAPTDRTRFKPRNKLLAALPHETRWRLRPQLKPVSLARSDVLRDLDEPLMRVYFVDTGL